MKDLFDTDICVIGAGPAGCVTAKILAELGHHVCIVESKTFPRAHVGICISEDTYVVLEHIGVREVVEKAAFLKRRTTLVKWPAEPCLSPQTGFHADRGKFDEILLQSAVAAGAKSIQPARVKNLTAFGTGWKVAYEQSGKQHEIVARFIVDASGTGSILPGKKIRMAPPLFALHATWHLEEMPEYDGLIEAGKDAWLWFAKLNDKEAQVSLFTEPRHFLRAGGNGLQTHYLQLLRQFQLLQPGDSDVLKGQVEGCDAGSRYSCDPIGLNYIRVGDANVKIDPIASQGVHLAMSSALQAAVAINTILKKPENSSYAIDFYRSRQQERVNRFTAKTASVYKQVSDLLSSDSFWQNRLGNIEAKVQGGDTDVSLPEETTLVMVSAEATIHSVPVMKGSLIELLPALHHDSLDRPIAYIGGYDAASLLFEVGKSRSVRDIIYVWSLKMPLDVAWEIFSWFWYRGVLTRAA